MSLYQILKNWLTLLNYSWQVFILLFSNLYVLNYSYIHASSFALTFELTLMGPKPQLSPCKSSSSYSVNTANNKLLPLFVLHFLAKSLIAATFSTHVDYTCVLIKKKKIIHVLENKLIVNAWQIFVHWRPKTKFSSSYYLLFYQGIMNVQCLFSSSELYIYVSFINFLKIL